MTTVVKSLPQCLAHTYELSPFTKMQALTSGYLQKHCPQVRNPDILTLFNHGSCTSSMLVCSFDTRLANTAKAFLQCCRFICIKSIETGAIVATSYTLVRSKILSSGLSGLSERIYHLPT